MNIKEFREKKAQIVAALANAEGAEREKLQAELQQLREHFQDETAEMQREAAERANAPKFDREAFLRNEMREAIKAGQNREVSLNKLADTAAAKAASIADGAEAQNVLVMPLLPLAEPKTVWQKVGMKIQNGVPTDKIIWPYNTNAIELKERGEAQQAATEVLNWDNIKPDPYSASLMVIVDNEAIDNASFNLYAYVVEQLGLAKGRYFDKKSISSAKFTGMHGPLSGSTVATIDGTWKNIKKETAKISGTGLPMDGFCYVGNAMATAILETTPKANGQGGFILENGKIGAYPYYETEYACFVGEGTEEKPYQYDSTEGYLAFGPFGLLAACGHGVEKLVIDPVTLTDKNQTRFIFHTKNSLTELNTTDKTVFKMVKLNDVSDLPVKVSGTSAE